MKFGNWKVRYQNFNIPRYSWLPMVRSLSVFFALITIAVIGLASDNIPVNWVPKDKAVMARVSTPLEEINLYNVFLELTRSKDFNYEGILRSELPMWQELNSESSENNPKKAINRALYSVTQMDLANPDTYLKAEIPMLALVNGVSLAPMGQLPIPQLESIAAQMESKKELSQDILVAIYNTHTTETYEPTDGVMHMKSGQGGVYKVSLELKKVLEEKYGIKTISSDKIHDATNFNFSYGASLVTAQELVEQNKNLQVLIDLHRDGAYGDKSVTTTKINGKDTAKIYIIMGTDGNLPYPNWQKNRAFADKLNARMNAMYPGLSRGVKQDIYRYNQHLHDHAILIEVGGTENSLEEAKRGIDLFADVLASVLNEQKN